MWRKDSWHRLGPRKHATRKKDISFLKSIAWAISGELRPARARMSEHAAEAMRERVEAVYRSESRHVLATLIRLLGDFDVAEEALHDAFTSALEQWPRDGMPANPRAWLVSACRF